MFHKLFLVLLTLYLFRGPGPVVHAEEMSYPLAVAVTADNTVYVADRKLPGIREITDNTAKIYYQGSKKFRTPLNAIRCLALDEKGQLLAGDSATREIYRFDKNKQPVALTKGRIGIPMAIAVSKAGTIFVADLETHRIWKVPSAGGKPEEMAQVVAPRGMALDSREHLWIVSHGRHPVVKLNPEDGSLEPVIKGASFKFAHQIVLKDDTAFVVDGYAKTIWKVQPDKEPQVFASGEPFKNPVGIARSKTGFLVADPHRKTIYEVSKDGAISPHYPKEKPESD